VSGKDLGEELQELPAAANPFAALSAEEMLSLGAEASLSPVAVDGTEDFEVPGREHNAANIGARSK
jgi:hypothetical protein